VTTHRITLTLGPVPWVYALVYRSRGMSVPIMRSSHHPGALIPLRLRALHKAYASRLHLYWLPCVLCGREYGGHEITEVIPDPTEGDGRGIVICPFCTIERNQRGPRLRRASDTPLRTHGAEPPAHTQVGTP
jgi:hypothetical protein